ncbi:MAG: glycosyltransferase [Planctomycetes bacterium]|nr:glycosyltransferase [Planctomycetota bacterium]
MRLVAGVVHDGEFIGRWLGLTPDICPDQGLTPTADELAFVPEPPPTSAAYIGRIEPDSGIQIYIDAVEILAGNMKRQFHLDVYGDGSLLPSLRKRVDRADLPVTFHGRVANAQDRVVEACFAFIDGRMAIQEAMARRRLVLAGYTDPLKRDYVAGELFSPHIVTVSNGAELADQVAYYIDHPDKRHALIERAYLHARTLTWPRTAEAYTSLWAKHLASRTPRQSRWEFLKTALLLNHEASTAKTTWAP